MSAQHHEASAARSQPSQIDPETQQHLNELMSQITEMDNKIRSLPDSLDPESDMRKLQARRNEVQAEYDALAAEVRRGGTVRTARALEERESAIAAERDQLVVAQNAPFTGGAPMAQGGESSAPDGVIDSNGPHPAPGGIPRPNRAGVLHHGQLEPSDT